MLNKQFSKRNSKRFYLLGGLVRCPCGASLCGEYFSEHRYYRCTWGNNHHGGFEGPRCIARSTRADALEADVWESIVGIFCNSNDLERLMRIAQQEELDELGPKNEELSAVEALIVETERDANEIGRTLKKARGVVAKSLENNMESVNDRYEALCNRRDILKVELNKAQLTDESIQEAIRFAQDVQSGIENADYETKRRNLELLKIEVTVNTGRFYIKSLAGEWEGDIRKIPSARKVGIVQVSH